jgi:hypothetical protein
VARRAPPAPLDPKLFWVCERCRSVSEGANPPAECGYCGYEYHDNMYDIDPTFGAEDLAELDATAPKRRAKTVDAPSKSGVRSKA